LHLFQQQQAVVEVEHHSYRLKLLEGLSSIRLMVEFSIDIMHLGILEVIKLSVLVKWEHIILLKCFLGELLAVLVDKVVTLAALVDLDIDLLLI
jgi:hypothetical protein